MKLDKVGYVWDEAHSHLHCPVCESSYLRHRKLVAYTDAEIGIAFDCEQCRADGNEEGMELRIVFHKGETEVYWKQVSHPEVTTRVRCEQRYPVVTGAGV